MPQSHRPIQHPDLAAPVDPVQPTIAPDEALPEGPNYLLDESGEPLEDESGNLLLQE